MLFQLGLVEGYSWVYGTIVYIVYKCLSCYKSGAVIHFQYSHRMVPQFVSQVGL